jgi:hypothetical protein
MDFGIKNTSSFNHSSASNTSVCDYMDSSSLVPENCTYQGLHELSTGVTALLFVFYCSFSFFAVVGNFLVMWIVITTRRMLNVTNILIANLALSDIIIGLFIMPFQVSRSAPTNIFQVIFSLIL